MPKDKDKRKLSDDELNISGGVYYKEGGFGRPYVVFDRDLKEHRAWTEKGAKELDKKLNGRSEKLTETGYHVVKSMQSCEKDHGALFENDE